jgi:carboxyl-terminal processing protease
MTPNNSRRAIYFPLILAVVLVIGFYLGLKLAPVSTSGDGMLFVRPTQYNKVGEIIRYIEQDYVDSVALGELEENAIEGILDNLDPHSYYISPEDYHNVNDPLTGNFEGIGIQFRIEKDTIMVIQTIAGGPSEKVGLLAGDRIVRINDSLVAGVGITNTDVMKHLKGPRDPHI